MAEYGSGIFYGRSRSNQNIANFSQLGLLSLPPELDIGPPLTTPVIKQDPETTTDVILLAEFSEIEGPIPLLSLPRNIVSDINLNNIVVQLMSTDYQNMGSNFQIHKDTCLLQEDSEKGHYIFVHYFTLYDVRARGFVRPMCLAYISRESQKLKKYFPSIQKEFTKVTEYLRISNLKFFYKEMKNRIEDLYFTKERYIQSQHISQEQVKHTSKTIENLKEKSLTIDRRKRTLSLSSGVLHSPCSACIDKSSLKKNSSDNSFDSNKEETLKEGCTLPTRSHKRKHSFPTFQKGNLVSSSLPISNKCVTVAVSPTGTEIPTDSLRPTFLIKSPQLRPHSILNSRNSPRDYLCEGLNSYSSDSSSSTLKSSKDYSKSRPAMGGVQASFLMHDYSFNKGLSHTEEMSLLEHTSLDALAVQLLDCQYILDFVKSYLEDYQTEKELNQFLDEIKSKRKSPLYVAIEELGILKSHTTESEFEKEPTIFVITLLRRSFRNMRTIRSLCGIGYVACVAKLLDIYQKFSKPTLTLMFEDLDRDIHENPFPSLFIGNIPIINVGNKGDTVTKVKVARSEKFSLSDSCWNEELIHLLGMDLSKSSTPTSEYADAKEIFEKANSVPVADDCLEVFTPTEEVEARRASASSNYQGSEEGNSGSDLEGVESQFKVNSFWGRGSSYRSIPFRSTSSESSWASSTPRDLTLDGMENELEEWEEEEVVCDVNDTASVKIVPHDVYKRMEMGRLYHMSTLIQQFSGVSQCFVHSILSGKPMIVAAPESLKAAVVIYTKTLSMILPVKPNEFLPVLKWHTGTITPHHLKMYKIIGICIPERLHVQDLMSNATLNQVTVLNIETGHISGVAYSGSLLYKAEQLSRRNFRSDASLQTALQSILVGIGMKVFLFFHLCRTTTRTQKEILKAIGVQRGDWTMVQYLSQMIEQQMV